MIINCVHPDDREAAVHIFEEALDEAVIIRITAGS